MCASVATTGYINKAFPAPQPTARNPCKRFAMFLHISFVAASTATSRYLLPSLPWLTRRPPHFQHPVSTHFQHRLTSNTQNSLPTPKSTSLQAQNTVIGVGGESISRITIGTKVCSYINTLTYLSFCLHAYPSAYIIT